MAFKPRNKDNGIEKVANVDDLSENINGDTKNKQKYGIPEIKSFKDQAIEVLNILDKKGINIYDENRTPGMYLKRNSEQTIGNKKLKNILSELPNNLTQNNHQQEQRNTPKNILDFLSNQK